MSSLPLISVIIPTYNQDRFIGRCLRSLIVQKMQRDLYELIVINDGSTDQTSFALKQFGSSEAFQVENKNCLRV